MKNGNGYNTDDSRSLKQLCQAIRRSHQPWKPFLDRYRRFARELVGFNYSDNGTPDRRPINLAHLERTILLQNLIVENPQVMVRADDVRKLPDARLREKVVNKIIRRMRLAGSLRASLGHAYLLIGVTKTGVTSGGVVDIGGVNHEVGMPFADPVSPVNFGFDMEAPTWDQIGFCYDRYQRDYDAVMESGAYNKAALKKLKPCEPGVYGDESDDVRSLSVDQPIGTESFGRIAKLMDIWLPGPGVVVTLPDLFAYGSDPEIPLSIVKWTGSPRGPYHRLALDDAPDQLVPLSPIMQTMDWQHASNVMLNKYLRQVINLKTNPIFPGGSEQDMQRLISAPDMRPIRIEGNPERIKSIQSGNPDPRIQAAVIYGRQMWSYVRGNIEAQGGLADLADTLGEARMITDSASKMIDMYQNRVLEYVSDVCADIAEYVENDPLLTEDITESMPGSPDIILSMTVTADRLAQSRGQYQYDIVPYSMRSSTPATRLQAIQSIVQGIIVPMLPLMMNPQSPIDVGRLARIAARAHNVEAEIDECLRRVPPLNETPARDDVEGQVHAPPQTNRTYTRVNKPAGSRQGNDAALATALLSGVDANQPDMSAGLIR